VAGTALMAAFALFQPLWIQHGIPLEWKLIAAWTAIGLVFRRIVRNPPVDLGEFRPRTPAESSGYRALGCGIDGVAPITDFF
jgi:hypothetical protein